MLVSAAVTKQGPRCPSTLLAAHVDIYVLLLQVLRGALCQQWSLVGCHCPLRARKAGGGLLGLSLCPQRQDGWGSVCAVDHWTETTQGHT